MECEKVQDRFSSLWEKELMPSEEENIREHLSSCPECQKEFKQFEKTMHWLHSVGEVEVPEGFFTELQKKMEERKSQIIPKETARGRWFNLPSSVRLPVQAVAMTTIIFLVLYITKMVPPPSPLSVDKKPEHYLAQKEVERDQRPMEVLPEVPRPKEVGQGKVSVTGKGKLEVESHPQDKAEADKVEVPPPKAEIMAYPEQIGEGRETGGKAISPEPPKLRGEFVAKQKADEDTKLPQEIILRISDREKVTSQLLELLKQFGGEIITAEKNMLLASLPTNSSPEFEKELIGLRTSVAADKMFTKKPVAGSSKAAPEGKREATEAKSEEPIRHKFAEEGRITIRILLVEE
jgi:hypothetical protein